MDNAGDRSIIWTTIGVGIGLATLMLTLGGLILTQINGLQVQITANQTSLQAQITANQTSLQAQITANQTSTENRLTGIESQNTELVDRVSRLETHVEVLREDVAYLAGRRSEPATPDDKPAETP